MGTISTFQRVEKKYILRHEQYDRLIEALGESMHQDEYGLHTITNIYFDTPDHELIRKSIEKPSYKEKFRIRSYGIPGEDTKIYLEIKKKYKGVVYKRRIGMTLSEAKSYLFDDLRPTDQGQIFNEIDFMIRRYELKPALYLAYDRRAWIGNEDPGLRITFDTGIRSRRHDLYLEHGDYGTKLLNDDQVLMEIKVPGALPLWLAHLLTEFEIFPISFSKYGSIYKNELLQEREKKGDNRKCLQVF